MGVTAKRLLRLRALCKETSAIQKEHADIRDRLAKAERTVNEMKTALTNNPHRPQSQQPSLARVDEMKTAVTNNPYRPQCQQPSLAKKEEETSQDSWNGLHPFLNNPGLF